MPEMTLFNFVRIIRLITVDSMLIPVPHTEIPSNFAMELFWVGASLSEPHTSETALHTCVFIFACLRPSGAYERRCTKERQSMYHTLVGPILCRIWHLQNAPYEVAACCTYLRTKQVAIVTAGGVLLRIHSSHRSNLKAD